MLLLGRDSSSPALPLGVKEFFQFPTLCEIVRFTGRTRKIICVSRVPGGFPP